MNRRYLRLDIEYDFDSGIHHMMVGDNIRRILEEDMPYVRVIFSRDTSIKEDLDNPSYKGVQK